MTLVIKSNKDNTIYLPAWLMKNLKLREGAEVKTMIEGRTLRLTPLDQFLSLQGVLKEDKAFDEAMTNIDKAWQEWKLPKSL